MNSEFKPEFQYVRVILQNGFTAAEVQSNLRLFLTAECRLTDDEASLFIDNTADDLDVARMCELADGFGFSHLRSCFKDIGLNMGSQIRVLNGCRRVFNLLS